jgi:hypothetical protein
MATQVVELTGDEAALLRSLQKVIDKERDHERQLGRMADAGDTAGIGLEQAMLRVEQANEKAIKSMISDLSKLGPEGRAAADALKAQFVAMGQGDFKTVDGILTDMEKLTPAAAEAASKTREALADMERKDQFRETLTRLRELGGEGAKVANRLEAEMKQAALESAGGMDSIVDHMRRLDPAAAEVAARIRTELTQADAATRMDNSLAELRKLSPEAAKAAEKVRNEMSLADRQVKFDNIIAELKKVDPAAAKEAEKLRGTLKRSADDSVPPWKSFADSAISNIKLLAGAFLGAQGLQGAIEIVNGLIAHQGKLIDSAASKQLTLAKAQQEAIKNLAALSRVQQSELLTTSVGKIASTAGVGDAAAITNALGGAISGGATEAQAVSAVTAAAQLNRLTPEKIGATSSAAVDFGKATGVDDARANIALLTSTGTQSRIEDPQALAKNLAPALSNAVNTVQGQDSQDATREAAAIFAAFTQATADTQGDSSRTATVQFTAELGRFFQGLERERVEARSKIELIDRKIAKGSDTEKDREDRAILDTFLQDAKELQDPETLFGRIEALQQNQGIRDQFFSREFGEVKFKGAFKQLGDSTSEIAQQIRTAKEKIEVDSKGFDRLLEATTSLTPQLRAANIVAGVQAASEMRANTDIEGATLSQIRSIAKSTLEETRPSGFLNIRANMAEEAGVEPGVFNPSLSAAEEAVNNLDRLLSRRTRIADDGVTKQEQPIVAQLDAAIFGIRELVVQQFESLDPETIAAAAARAGAKATIASAQFQTERAEFFAKLQAELNTLTLSPTPTQVPAVAPITAPISSPVAPMPVGTVTQSPIASEQPAVAPITAPTSEPANDVTYNPSDYRFSGASNLNSGDILGELKTIAAQQLVATNEQSRLVERQNALTEENNRLLRQTADNTAPVDAPPADPAAVSAAAFAQEDSR